MFILTTLSDVISIEPADFYKPSAQALEDNINQKYANKVIQKVGLCICFYDLLSASDGLIGHGDGLVNVNAKFRIIVFRPFKSELLTATIASCTPTSITCETHFFPSITVPAPSGLFAPAHYDPAEHCWIWTNDGTPFYFDRNERVRLRVEEEVWTDLGPIGPPGATGEAGRGLGEREITSAGLTNSEVRKGRTPYRIVGSMQQGGLGVMRWW